MNYIAGKTIAESRVTRKDLYEVGKLAATVDKTLQTVSLRTVSVAEFWPLLWELELEIIVEKKVY